MTELINSERLIMSSKEIAELTNKNHADIMRDIRNLANDLAKSTFAFCIKESNYKSSTGQNYSMYVLDKDTTIALITGYSAPLRMAIIKRWQELESQSKPLSTLDIIRIAEQSELGRLKALEDNALLELEIKKNTPKLEYLDKVLSSPDTMVTTVIAGDLGMSAKALNKKLQEKRIQRKVDGQWQLTTKYCNKGYTTTKIHTHIDSKGIVRISRLLVWTEIGKAFLHKLFNSSLSYSFMNLSTPQLATA